MTQCRICKSRRHKINQQTQITPELMLAFHALCMRNNNENEEVDLDSWHFICRICKMHMGEELTRPTQLGVIQIEPTPLTFMVPPTEDGICFICGARDPAFEATLTTRVSIYVASELYIDPGTKICLEHVDESTQIMKICPQLSELEPVEHIVRLTASEIQEWLRENRQVSLHYRDLPFKMAEFMINMSEEDFKMVYGITKPQMEDLFSHTEAYRAENGIKCSKTDLLMFLLKLRQGQSLNYLKALFGYQSKGAVSVRIKAVRNALLQHFVPRHLGTDGRNREDILPHVTGLARTLHFPEGGGADNIVFIADGTYIYIPKSYNFTDLKRTYCLHKGRHLIKMTMCVMPDGYILDVHGPYYSDSKNNDASTLKHALTENTTSLRNFLREGDVLIVDRGYRDCLPFLEALGLTTDMPRYLHSGQKQHSTEDANASRIVTKTRWIVEVRNGHIKSVFKFFQKTIDAGNVPYIGEYFKIACALINAYRPVIITADSTSEVARMLLERRSLNNEVKTYVETNRLTTRRISGWRLMETVELEEFPRMSLDDLRGLTLGQYQIKQAAAYNAEVEQDDADRKFYVAKETDTLLKAQLHSRHSTIKDRFQFIRFVPNGRGQNAITGWYCTCITGARTVGMCSHVCAVLWYLCIDRYEPVLRRPKRRLQGIAQDAGKRDG